MADQLSGRTTLNIRNNHDAEACFAYFEFLESHGKVRPRPPVDKYIGGLRRHPTSLAEWKADYRVRSTNCIGPLLEEMKESLADNPFAAEISGILDAIVGRLREQDRAASGESLLAQLHALGYDVSNLTRR